jgi:hypothetical protein
MATEKLAWQGRVISVQPRIRLLRSFDERSHSYLGYVVQIDGVIGREKRAFTLGIGKAAQAKHGLRNGDQVSGFCVLAADPKKEPAEFYRVSRLKIFSRGPMSAETSPPWQGVAPNLEEYRKRGHRRLAVRTYTSKCLSCIWACRMAVEMIVDHWNPQHKRYRSETFCYGPKSCPFYKSGPTRKVPGRKGMVWEEQDWVDEDATAHRTIDE